MLLRDEVSWTRAMNSLKKSLLKPENQYKANTRKSSQSYTRLNIRLKLPIRKSIHTGQVRLCLSEKPLILIDLRTIEGRPNDNESLPILPLIRIKKSPVNHDSIHKELLPSYR